MCIVIGLIGVYFLMRNGWYEKIVVRKEGIIFGFVRMVGFRF